MDQNGEREANRNPSLGSELDRWKFKLVDTADGRHLDSESIHGLDRLIDQAESLASFTKSSKAEVAPDLRMRPKSVLCGASVVSFVPDVTDARKGLCRVCRI
jgi:hypothetical protein